MPESLTDEQILGIQDDAPAPAPEVSEAQAPSPEASEEPTSQQSESTAENQSEENLASETPDKVSEKPQPETAEKPQAEAETLEEQFPRGRDQAAEVIGKASELDAMDAALRNGDRAGMAEVALNAYEQGPEAYPQLLSSGVDVLREKAPERHAQFVASVVGEELQEQGVWPFLEQVYEVTPPGPARDLLNRFAGFLGAYGLGPANPVAEKIAFDNFRRDTNTDITNSLNRQMERTAPPGFAGAPADLRGKFIQAVHEQVQQWAKNDPKLREDAENAARGASTRRARNEVANLLFAKAQSVLPAAMKQVLGRPEYAALHKVAASPANVEEVLTPGSEAVNRMDDRAIMNWTGKVGARSITPRKQKVSADQARHMPFSRLLDDAIEV